MAICWRSAEWRVLIHVPRAFSLGVELRLINSSLKFTSCRGSLSGLEGVISWRTGTSLMPTADNQAVMQRAPRFEMAPPVLLDTTREKARRKCIFCRRV